MSPASAVLRSCCRARLDEVPSLPLGGHFAMATPCCLHLHRAASPSPAAASPCTCTASTCPADQYPVGKERMEPLGIIVFSVIMGTAAFEVIVEGVKVRWVDGSPDPTLPGLMAHHQTRAGGKTCCTE